MFAFAMITALAADPHVPEDGSLDGRWHVRLDTAATWGIGGQMFLGVQVHPTVYRPVWTTSRATGTVDLGLNLNYGNEPTFLAPWVDRSVVSGAGHRVQALATVGGTFHMAPKRRFGLGLHGFAGVSEWISDYQVEFAAEDFAAATTVSRAHVVAGGQATFSYRVHRHVGIDVVALAHLPLASSYAISFGHVGAGLSFYLR